MPGLVSIRSTAHELISETGYPLGRPRHIAVNAGPGDVVEYLDLSAVVINAATLPYGGLTARDGDPGRAVMAASVGVIRLPRALPAGCSRGSPGAQPGRAPATARDG
jgi:hypothetical protein